MPHQLNHLGDHLRARRIELVMLQKDAARRLGVDSATVANWELGNTEPEDRFIPAVIAFLGYNPLPVPATLGQAVRRERISCGWSQAKLAANAAVDPATVARLEADTNGMARRSVTAIRMALGLAQA